MMHMLVLLCVFVALTNSQASSTIYDNCENLSLGITVRWKVDTAANGVYFNLIGTSLPLNTFIAFGPSAGRGTMIDSDPAVGYYDGTSVVFHDYYLGAKQACSTAPTRGVCKDTAYGGSESLTSVSTSYTGTTLNLEWFRLLNTGDTPYDVTLVPASSTSFVYAKGPIFNGDLDTHTGNVAISLTLGRTPAYNCPITTCGNGAIDSGEQCDGGTSCTNCRCNSGTAPTNPVSRDCAAPCGNNRIDGGEQCDGGTGCTNCVCTAGFESTLPISLNCRALCGNGRIDAGEQCDGGTECTNCVCNSGFIPTSPISANCRSRCGNGVLDAGEQCDGGTGCSASCTCTGLHQPTSPLSLACQLRCGNGVVDAGEQCDGGTSCTNCVCQSGFESTTPVSASCQAICGNGELDAGEQCDSGTGCTNCICGTGFSPSGGLTCTALCGNGAIDAGEQCDGGTECTACTCNTGFGPSLPVSVNCVAQTSCGNSALDTASGEQCDGGTGCTACKCNTGYEQTSPASTNCRLICGNGRVDAGEQCDGGNSCTNCLCASGFIPTSPASADCQQLCGNGAVDAGEQCDGGASCTNCVCDPGFEPQSPPAAACLALCGNGVINSGEQCEGGTFCTNCLCNVGFFSTDPVGPNCEATCGNQVLDSNEACDGGAFCTNCQCDVGFVSTVPLSFDCVATCGNGAVDQGEQCDGGDFCSTCVCDLGYQPTDPASVDCVAKCGNGVSDDGEQCDGGEFCEADCNCDADHVPTSPPSLDCTVVSAPGALTGNADPRLVELGYTNYMTVDCDMEIYWMPLNDSDTSVSFVIRAATTGWIAMGFTDGSYSMVGSDAVLGWDDGAGETVGTYDLQGKDVEDIAVHSNFSISAAEAEEIDGITSIFFTRAFATGNNPIVDTSAVTVIFAWHTEDLLAEHTCKSRGALVLNLINGTNLEIGGEGYQTAHGILMLFGFGYLMVFGVIYGRYGRETTSSWVYIHLGLQILGLILATVGIIVVFAENEGQHFDTAFHAQLGLTVFILAWLQSLGGIFRPHLPDGHEKKSTPRKVFEIIHPNLGRIIILLAVITIFAGISEAGWHWWVYIFYGSCLGVLLVLCILLEALSRSSDKVERV